MKDSSLSPQKIHKLRKKTQMSVRSESEVDEPVSCVRNCSGKQQTPWCTFSSLPSAAPRTGHEQILSYHLGQVQLQSTCSHRHVMPPSTAHWNRLSWLQSSQPLSLRPYPTPHGKAAIYLCLILSWQVNSKLWQFLIPQATL